MQLLNMYQRYCADRLSGQVALLLIVSLLLWGVGAPVFLSTAQAASFSDTSDTLTDSDLGVTSGHTLQFTTQSVLDSGGASDTITVQLDPGGNGFQITDLDVADFTATSSISIVSACTGSFSDEFTLATTSEDFTLTICAGDTVATSSTIIFTIASSTSIITNPSSANSYVVRVTSRQQGGAILDTADTRVAIIDDVTVSASVDTVFDFTIEGLASGTAVNGDTTSTTTSPTEIQFGTLAPATPVIAGQRLKVNTNSQNGFTVTVKLDHNLTSSAGADIDEFIEGNGQVTPVVWASPVGVFGSENTYGHFGLTSEDDTLSTGDPFGSQLYAGNFSTTTREVFYHTGPADETIAGEGVTDVAYQIEINTLQEAGTDYTAQLTYVATPTF